MPKPLKLLQASAGSGKTFSLTAHYLTLLFSKDTKYREILAVTFTNKATEEMKTRILDDLHSLTEGKPKTTAIQKIVLAAHPHLTPDTLKVQAERIYRRLLHDYGRFSVSTIDGFVQKVIRGFTFELGIDAGYELEMNFDKVKAELADRLNRQLDENPALLKWVIDLAMDRIEDDKGWNYHQELTDLAGEIFKERYRPFEQAIQILLKDKNIDDIFGEYSQTTRQIISDHEKGWTELATQANQIYNGTNLDNFVGKSRSPLTNITKIAERDFDKIDKLKKLLDEPTEWAKAGQDNSLYHRLNPILKQLIESYQTGVAAYTLAVAVDKHLYFLRLMQEMAILLKSYRQETGTLLISDAQELLQGIIGDDDTNPSFIWEKTGNRYKHFLFDEFQDTSGSQWSNFRPLLKNMIAESEGLLTEHLVVGDPKQSIYRWRNGDWNILHQLVREQVGVAYIIEENLEVNYRSSENIIKFNNLLFGTLPNLIQTQLNESVTTTEQPALQTWWAERGYDHVVVDLYAQASQNTHLGTPVGGTVQQTTLREDEDGAALTNDTFQIGAMAQAAREINRLVEEKGYRFGEICVLVRKNDQAIAAVEALMAENIPVISGEALKIAGNLAVKLLVHTLKVLGELPHNTAIFKATCISLYAKLNGRLFDPEQMMGLGYKSVEELQQVLPAELCTNWQRWLQLPLPELIERLIGAYGLDQPAHAAHLTYLLAFRDLAGGFASKGETGLTAFIDWWDEEGVKKALPSNEHPNAVQVMTIHKSKGLAFRAVLLPFCNWPVDGKANSVFWVPAADTVYDELQSLPVRYQKALGKSAVAHAYFEELMLNYMDGLNMLYVAVTRAKDYLSIITKGKKTEEKLTDSGDMVTSAIKLFPGFQQYRPDADSLLFATNEGVADSSSQVSHSNEIKLDHYPLSERLHEVLSAEQTDAWSLLLSRDTALREGAILHELLSRINTPSEIAAQLQLMVLEGIVKNEETTHFTTIVGEVLNNPELKTLLNDATEILSEQSIISVTGESYRPDKVLVKGESMVILDYKFTQQEEASHERQVTLYKNLLLDMGYAKVETYLYYALSGKLKTV